MEEFQKNFYTQFIDSLDEAVIVLSCDLIILKFNKVASSLFNNQLKVGDSVKSSFDIVGFNFPFDNESDLQKTFYIKPKRENTLYPSLKYIRWNVKPISNHSENYCLLLGSDTSNEQNLRNYFESLVVNMPGNVFWKDSNSTYLGCNDRMAKICGLKSRYDIVGKTDKDLIWGSDLSEQFTKDDNEVIRTGKPKFNIIEQHVYPGSYEQCIMLASKVPLKDDSGDIIGILGVATDITKQKKLEKELSEAKTREAHFKAMSSIGGMLAHELRTPLSSIAVNIQNLKTYLPTIIKAYREYSKISNIKKIREHKLNYFIKLPDTIEQSARYANTTINTILAGLRHSTLESTPVEVVDVNVLLKEALAEYPLTQSQRKLISIKSRGDCRAMAAPNILIHVLHNLLKNSLYAIKEVSKGKITIIAKKSKKNTVEVIFKDTGKGISEDIKERIFEPFYTTKGSETSIGLGLYFCKMALEKIGGSIDCVSKYGSYTVFLIRLKGILDHHL